MTRLACRPAACTLVVALVAACASPEVPSAVPSAPAWGPRVDGLALRAEIAPVAACGDWLACDVFADSDSGAAGEVATLDPRPLALFLRLRLRPVDGGPEIVVGAADPTCGLPDPPPPDEPLERRVMSGARLTQCEFPLTSACDALAPGAYTAVVELVHDGSFSTAPYSVAPLAGSLSGTLVSPPLELRLDPAPERSLEIHVPAAFLGGDVDGTLRFPVRNGFAAGIHYRGQFADGSTGGSLGGGPEPGMFDEILADIAASRVPATFTIFETSHTPEHMWSPAPGRDHYRVLWQR